jgi:DNA-binding LacI/PurR family transcriptional regulator
MGQAVVALLVSEVAGNEVPADELLFEPELVVRGSTGPVPLATAPRPRTASV